MALKKELEICLRQLNERETPLYLLELVHKAVKEKVIYLSFDDFMDIAILMKGWKKLLKADSAIFDSKTAQNYLALLKTHAAYLREYIMNHDKYYRAYASYDWPHNDVAKKRRWIIWAEFMAKADPAHNWMRFVETFKVEIYAQLTCDLTYVAGADFLEDVSDVGSFLSGHNWLDIYRCWSQWCKTADYSLKMLEGTAPGTEELDNTRRRTINEFYDVKNDWMRELRKLMDEEWVETICTFAYAQIDALPFCPLLNNLYDFVEQLTQFDGAGAQKLKKLWEQMEKIKADYLNA